MSNLGDKVRDAKAWWKSNTAVGLVFLVVPAILKLISPSFTGDVEGAADIALEGGEEIAMQLDQLFLTILQYFGGIKTALGIRKAAGGEKLTIK